jgi:hypothetical protein
MSALPMFAEFGGIPPADLQRTNYLAAKSQELSLVCECMPDRIHLEMMEAHMTALISHHTEYDSFLYAIVVERNGLPITVVSMLSRLSLDPWLEAARLAQLPRNEAIDSLSASIRRSEGTSISPSQATALASKLAERLPTRGTLVAGAMRQETLDFSSMWLLFAIFFGMMAFSQSVPRPNDHPSTEQVAAQKSDPAVLHHDGPRKQASRSAPPIHIQH